MKQFLCIAVLACLACARKFRAATEVPSSQKVSDCFDEETARLERQKQQSGPFDFLGDALGFVGGLCPGGGGSSSGRRRRRSLLIQTNESTQLIGPLCAVTAGASMVVDAVNGQIQKAHDAENFAATDCNRMAAEMTLQKLEGLERKLEDGLNDVNSELQNLNGMINNVQGAMQANHAETKRLLQDLADHVEEGKQQMREIEANLDSRMLALGTATATLSAKLDLLSNKVTKSMEQNARAQYNVLLATQLQIQCFVPLPPSFLCPFNKSRPGFDTLWNARKSVREEEDTALQQGSRSQNPRTLSVSGSPVSSGSLLCSFGGGAWCI